LPLRFCWYAEKLWRPYKTSSDQASRNLTLALEAATLSLTHREGGKQLLVLSQSVESSLAVFSFLWEV
jgi:hypothetical protein